MHSVGGAEKTVCERFDSDDSRQMCSQYKKPERQETHHACTP